MDSNQRKAIFAYMEEQKRMRDAQLAATEKLKKWKNKEGD